MASAEKSLEMMSLQIDWPMGDELPMKKPLGQGPPPSFGHMKKEGCTPCRIYNDKGAVIAEYANAYEAIKAGWRVD